MYLKEKQTSKSVIPKLLICAIAVIVTRLLSVCFSEIWLGRGLDDDQLRQGESNRLHQAV